jgi:hypothetical protein
MGNLQRREGDGWAPCMTRTTQLVDMEGTPVPVAWLEEEILGYIRRGRLERAARCLEGCNPARLLTLLRGEQPQGVI